MFGQNLSGLAYQPSGTSAPGVLWAVRNSPSTLFRLVYDGTKWVPDPANGWGAGKRLRYPGGLGNPDAEGVTLAGGDPNGVYVATERDGSGASRPAVLRFDVSSASATLSATRDWNLLADLPGLGSNTGPEAITWVPDDVLVSKGFLDEATGTPYDPAAYPSHGAGLFLVGIEQDGRILAYALNQTTNTFTRVATIASGFPKVMALEYDPNAAHVWAVCDNNCSGQHATLDVAQSGAADGRFAVTDTLLRPAGMANLNNEGFAISAQAECLGGARPVFWANDANTDSHALRAGTLNCAGPPPPPPPPPTSCLDSAVTILGTAGDDTLMGTSGPDVIAGLGGADTIKGQGGNDKICGGEGIDNLAGNNGNDALSGDAGNDTFGEGSAVSGADVFSGGGGTDVANYGSRTVAVMVTLDGAADDGGAGEADNVMGDVENVSGGSAGDTITTSGSNLANKLLGRGGNDSLNVLDGIGGNDRVDGGLDSDSCTADAGDVRVACP
ncbi:MAG: hypothetical protein M3Y34_09165 [Actinomycetota bacterium]|nr:hypothetical protein [Actinomycetota bacterium]